MEGEPTMIWQDAIVQLALSDQEVAEGFATAFGIDSTEVIVHRGEDEFPEPDGAKIICVVSERQEGFRIALVIYVYFDITNLDSIAIFKKFARLTHSEILISDDSLDPYVMIQIMPNGELMRVSLDVDRLDCEGEYHVRPSAE